MKVLPTCCADCPFKKVSDEVRCKLVPDALLMGTGLDDHDYISTKEIHPDCPMLGGRIVVTLGIKTKLGAGGMLPAFLGNRVRITDGRRGVVVGKFKNIADTGMTNEMKREVGQEYASHVWYQLLLDGNLMIYAADTAIQEIVEERSKYNYNQDFEFYFGFGGGDDET